MWWSWAVWVDPFSYALRALVANEFSAPRWDAPYNEFSSRRRRFTIGQAVLQVRPELSHFLLAAWTTAVCSTASPDTCLVQALGQGVPLPECGETATTVAAWGTHAVWCQISCTGWQGHRLARHSLSGCWQMC